MSYTQRVDRMVGHMLAGWFASEDFSWPSNEALCRIVDKAIEALEVIDASIPQEDQDGD